MGSDCHDDIIIALIRPLLLPLLGDEFKITLNTIDKGLFGTRQFIKCIYLMYIKHKTIKSKVFDGHTKTTVQ